MSAHAQAMSHSWSYCDESAIHVESPSQRLLIRMENSFWVTRSNRGPLGEHMAGKEKYHLGPDASALLSFCSARPLFWSVEQSDSSTQLGPHSRTEMMTSHFGLIYSACPRGFLYRNAALCQPCSLATPKVRPNEVLPSAYNGLCTGRLLFCFRVQSTRMCFGPVHTIAVTRSLIDGYLKASQE